MLSAALGARNDAPIRDADEEFFEICGESNFETLLGYAQGDEWGRSDSIQEVAAPDRVEKCRRMLAPHSIRPGGSLGAQV